MKKTITILLLMFALTISAQSKEYKITYKYMRMNLPNKEKAIWTEGSFGLIFNLEKQMSKMTLAIETSTIPFKMVSIEDVKRDDGVGYQRAKLEASDGTTSFLTLNRKEAQINFSDGSSFEFSN